MVTDTQQAGAAEGRLGDVVPFRSPAIQRDWTAYVGMIIFLASWAVLFATLFFAYGFLRSKTVAWPPVGAPRLPLGLPAINTAVVFLASLALHRGLKSVEAGRSRAGALFTFSAFVLGSLFLALQTVVWVGMYRQGLTPKSGQYASAFYMLTIFHALHVAIGLFALAWLSLQTYVGRYNSARHQSLKLWNLYWHFVGVIWVLMFLFVYLV